MPRKRSAKSIELEAGIIKAIAAINDKKSKSVYAAAKDFKVNRQTLINRLNDKASHLEGHESVKLLSHAEEKALVV